MDDNENSGESKLLADIERLQKSGMEMGETVFMRMLHELQVHQNELEMQNRALREAQLELEETRDRYANLYDYAPLAYFTFDRDGVIQEANLTGAAMLGIDRSSLAGVSFVNYVAAQDRQNFRRHLNACISGGVLPSIELSLGLVGDKPISVQMASVPSRSTSGELESCRMAFIDVTERKLAELKLRLASKALENAQEGIMLTDADRKILAVNPAFSKASGYPAEEVIGLTPSILKSGRHDDEYYRKMEAALQTDGGWQDEIWNRNKNGELYPEWLNIKVIKNENGEVDSYVGIFSGLANQVEMKKRLYELAYYDELTGLSNRNLLYDRLHHELLQSKRSGSLMAVLFVDLDLFKVINDTYGHEVGDKVLKEAAGRLVGCIREGDTLSRLGGDEFVAILKDIESESVAELVASRMVSALASPLMIDGHELLVTVSVGISIHPDDGDEVSVLLRHADTAMYYATQHGRNGYKYYEPTMNGGVNHHL
jgi:diguanylate cyclase (GGDEF)-like protein/PAS domain S-box-containing protein